MGVVSIEITFGDDRDLFMGIICTFMDYTEVKLKLIHAGKVGVEFLKPIAGSFGLKIEMVYFSIFRFITTAFNKSESSGFGLGGGIVG